MRIRIIALLFVTVALSACTTSGIRDREYLSVTGRVTYQLDTPIPANAELHVLLTENSPKKADDKVIDTISKVLKGNEKELEFSVVYSSDAIDQSSDYPLMACVTRDEKVILTSGQDIPVLTRGHTNAGTIRLDNRVGSVQTGGTVGLPGVL